LNDPCWDLETTEGFEDHHDELLAFRNTHERAWAQQRTKHVLARAHALGISGNIALVEYLETLEGKVHMLEAQVARLRGE
jgi:hypothetical protein